MQRSMSGPKRGRGQVSGEYRKYGRDVEGDEKGVASFSSDPEKWGRNLFGVKPSLHGHYFYDFSFFLNFATTKKV